MFGRSIRALVMCSSPGHQLIISAMLNRLEIFCIALCMSWEEIQLACARQPAFDLFIVDEFKLGFDELRRLEVMSKSSNFDQVILMGNHSSSERQQLFKWAWQKHVGLLDIIEKPLSPSRLKEALDRLVVFTSCSDVPVAAPSYPLFEQISQKSISSEMSSG